MSKEHIYKIIKNSLQIVLVDKFKTDKSAFTIYMIVFSLISNEWMIDCLCRMHLVDKRVALRRSYRQNIDLSQEKEDIISVIETHLSWNGLLTTTFKYIVGLAWSIVLSATLNNISVISWRSVLLVEETGLPGENHRPVVSHWQAWSHSVVSPEWHSNSQR